MTTQQDAGAREGRSNRSMDTRSLASRDEVAQQPREQEVNEWINAVIRDVAELPDRNSPEDAPEMMLVTEDELRAILALRGKPEQSASAATPG